MVKSSLTMVSEGTCNLARFVQCLNHEKEIMITSLVCFFTGIGIGYIMGVYL